MGICNRRAAATVDGLLPVEGTRCIGTVPSPSFSIACWTSTVRRGGVERRKEKNDLRGAVRVLRYMLNERKLRLACGTNLESRYRSVACSDIIDVRQILTCLPL